MEVELVAHTPDPAWVIEQAASVCYDSTPTRECKLVMQCYRSGHHSVLEHASFTFKISGISRACSHQLVRHRMASYSQPVSYTHLDVYKRQIVGLASINVYKSMATPQFIIIEYEVL